MLVVGPGGMRERSQFSYRSPPDRSTIASGYDDFAVALGGRARFSSVRRDWSQRLPSRRRQRTGARNHRAPAAPTAFSDHSCAVWRVDAHSGVPLGGWRAWV